MGNFSIHGRARNGTESSQEEKNMGNQMFCYQCEQTEEAAQETAE